MSHPSDTPHSSHVESRSRKALRSYIIQASTLLEIVLSGLVLWKSVQFPLLRELLGGYEAARRIHFIAMGALVAFVGVHVAMVALVPRTLVAMIRGH